MDGHTANSGETDKERSVPAEMLIPSVLSRVIKGREGAGQRVDSCNIRPFGSVAVRARERQILRLRSPAMMWSMWKGYSAKSCGKWQYSQREWARSQICCSRRLSTEQR
jgi:hypothetical protein